MEAASTLALAAWEGPAGLWKLQEPMLPAANSLASQLVLSRHPNSSLQIWQRACTPLESWSGNMPSGTRGWQGSAILNDTARFWLQYPPSLQMQNCQYGCHHQTTVNAAETDRSTAAETDRSTVLHIYRVSFARVGPPSVKQHDTQHLSDGWSTVHQSGDADARHA